MISLLLEKVRRMGGGAQVFEGSSFCYFGQGGGYLFGEGTY